MGKRGPAAKGEYADKSAVLSTSISAELRTALEKSVAQSGFTLSREVERRLRRTFNDDEKISEGFGTRRNRAIMHMVAMMTRTVYRKDQPEAEWLDDPWLFDQYMDRLDTFLKGLRPKGAAKMPANVYGTPVLDNEETHRLVGRQTVARLLQEVQSGDASLPLGAGKRGKFNILKADLGPIAARAEIVAGNADDFRESAKKLAPPKSQRSTKRKRK
jgi:hypothetical protein